MFASDLEIKILAVFGKVCQEHVDFASELLVASEIPMESRHNFCGIDFGTSNSTLAHVSNGLPALVALEADKTTLPSAVFYGHEQTEAFLIGRAAVSAYVDGERGRLLRSLKSILGHSLVNELTPVFKRKISFAAIIGQYLKEIKSRAENHLQTELTQVVLGRPVQFVDDNEAANIQAEKTLHDIARSIGFKDVSFQFEPVAAALEFERQLSREKLALIADIGGGTSDFSVVRLGGRRATKDRKSDVLASSGTRVGGTDFDRCLSMESFMPHFGYGTSLKQPGLEMPNAPFWELSTWSHIHNLYEPKIKTLLNALRFDAQKPELIERFLYLISERRCHALMMEVEETKIQLSDSENASSDLDWLEKDLSIEASRKQFEHSAANQYEKLKNSQATCLARAGIAATQIDVIFFTGGSSLIPSVRNTIVKTLPQAEIVNGDQFGAVGMGLGLEAFNRYG